MFKFINRTYIIGGTLLHIVWDKEKELGMINTYDLLPILINDGRYTAKSVLDKWPVKLKSKLNYNEFNMKVVAKGRNCYNCRHRNKSVTEEPCHTCLSQDNERTCWEFNCCPCDKCNTVKSAIVCHECESHHWMFYKED